MSLDSDYELARHLQAEYYEDQETQTDSKPRLQQSNFSDNIQRRESDKPLSIVDERWEMLDPTPDVRAMFIEFDNTFFKGKLAGVEVKWSPRMTLCAGVCSYEGRGGLCSIRLSTPLLKLRPRKDLVETLLHEMIHAFLFVTQNNKDRDGHGPEFCKHMNRINLETGTKISIYHSFQDEVDLYRQHIWRCDGPCRTQKPFFGYVKRAMNRAPSARDTWWSRHQTTCGGTFHKEKEPEGYGEKQGKRKREDANTKDAKKSKGRDVNSVAAFEGKVKTMNGNNSTFKVHPTLQEIWKAKTENSEHESSSVDSFGSNKSNGASKSDSSAFGTSITAGSSSTGSNKVASATQSNIHGFSGKVPAPTFHGFFKDPFATSTNTGKSLLDSDSGEGKENKPNKSNMITNGFNNVETRFPGQGQALGGKSASGIGHDKATVNSHWVNKQNKAKRDIEQTGSSGWLSKKSPNKQTTGNNTENIKNSKHIKMSQKIVKLMEIVGSDSDSDTDEKAPSSNILQRKATPVQYNISDSDEDEYNDKIYLKMFENEKKNSEIIAKSEKSNQFGSNSNTHSDQGPSREDKTDMAAVAGPTVKCPICGINALQSSINQHLDECLNQSFLNQCL
ncbi:uncharacterized protein [Antedon mediterranea]|uniref:uncharacterized protein n=1 Tax=Antedon mediterranea TaxID=105859 RepID=UPI003AF5B9F5